MPQINKVGVLGDISINWGQSLLICMNKSSIQKKIRNLTIYLCQRLLDYILQAHPHC